MSNTLIFLRHAKTSVDKSIPIEDWTLTDEGFKHSKETAETGDFDKVDLIFTSSERKSVETAKPIAERIKKEIVQLSELGEIKRPNSEKITLEEYKELKRKIFEDFDYSEQGWETVNQALNRFSDAVEEIDTKYENKTILIVAHGTVMSLFFAKLQNKLDELLSRWNKLGFCDWGIVKDGKVVKDIA